MWDSGGWAGWGSLSPFLAASGPLTLVTTFLYRFLAGLVDRCQFALISTCPYCGNQYLVCYYDLLPSVFFNILYLLQTFLILFVLHLRIRLNLNNVYLCFSTTEFLNKQNHLGRLYSRPGYRALGSHLHIPVTPYSRAVFLCFCLWLIIINGLGIELLSDVK